MQTAIPFNKPEILHEAYKYFDVAHNDLKSRSMPALENLFLSLRRLKSGKELAHSISRLVMGIDVQFVNKYAPAIESISDQLLYLTQQNSSRPEDIKFFQEFRRQLAVHFGDSTLIADSQRSKQVKAAEDNLVLLMAQNKMSKNEYNQKVQARKITPYCSLVLGGF